MGGTNGGHLCTTGCQALGTQRKMMKINETGCDLGNFITTMQPEGPRGVGCIFCSGHIGHKNPFPSLVSHSLPPVLALFQHTTLRERKGAGM